MIVEAYHGSMNVKREVMTVPMKISSILAYMNFTEPWLPGSALYCIHTEGQTLPCDFPVTSAEQAATQAANTGFADSSNGCRADGDIAYAGE